METLTLYNHTPAAEPVHHGIIRGWALNLSDSKSIARVAVLLLPFPFLLHYLFGLLVFHWAHLHPKDTKVPPTLPHLIPLLGSAVPFAFDGGNFVKQATKYAGSLVPVCLSILGGDIFLFQGPKTLAAVWKEQQLGSPIFVYTYALQNMFGMPKGALAAYRADDSGSHRRPHPDSNVAPHNRVDFLTHQILFKAFGGSGLNKSFDRCAAVLRRNLESLPLPEDGDWLELPDLWAFFQVRLGSAVVEGLYGPTLLRLCPGFLQDLWAFDRAAPKLAKLMPWFLIPGAYKVRGRLLDSIRRWHNYARQHFDESAIGPDGDADPYWGSELVRSRQKILLDVEGQDYEAIAAADLGLIWASATNVIPSSMMTALHIFRSPTLPTRLLSALQGTLHPFPSATLAELINPSTLLRSPPPLLLSIYAETLRLHLQAYVTRYSPHRDVVVAGWALPHNRVCMVNTYASHMDEQFWNTKGGQHPVDVFWAERFVIDPRDPGSGPVRADVDPRVYERPEGPSPSSSSSSTIGNLGLGVDTPGGRDVDGAEGKGEGPRNEQEPFFSVKGLEGAWIPYGGGYAACPGRHFAKRLILYTTALLVAAFEVEILTERLEMDDSCFGLGTQKPRHAVPFRIRRRRLGWGREVGKV